MPVNIEFKGGNSFEKNLRLVIKGVPEDVKKAMREEGEIEVTEMKKRCPVDITPNAPHPGNLRASIHMEEPEQVGRSYQMTYATGAQAPYAVYVHENLEAHHPVGEAKFIESVMKESAPYMKDRIGARMTSFKEQPDGYSDSED